MAKRTISEQFFVHRRNASPFIKTTLLLRKTSPTGTSIQNRAGVLGN